MDPTSRPEFCGFGYQKGCQSICKEGGGVKRFDTRNALEPQGAQLHQLSALVLEGRKKGKKSRKLEGGEGGKASTPAF